MLKYIVTYNILDIITQVTVKSKATRPLAQVPHKIALFR